MNQAKPANTAFPGPVTPANAPPGGLPGPFHLPVAKAPVDLSEPEYQRLRMLIYRTSGIHLGEDKKHLVRSRLQRRLRELGLESFTQYHAVLQDPVRGPEEVVRMLDEIATNTTDFFREPSHFDYMVQRFFPCWRDEPTIRVLSAGCSTGQEPYSVAMTAIEALGDRAGRQVKITAVDLSTRALQAAKQGIYSRPKHLGSVSVRRMHRFFLEGTGRWKGQVKVADPLPEMVRFRRVNLMDATRFDERYHAIFCCNVVIYFDHATQGRLFQRFHDALLPGGDLLMGHSESLLSHETPFRYVQPSLYRKGKS